MYSSSVLPEFFQVSVVVCKAIVVKNAIVVSASDMATDSKPYML